MANRVMILSEAISGYIEEMSEPRTEVQEQLVEATAALEGWSMMQIGQDQGAFLAMLVTMTQARTVVEVGTFTGYSALAMAMALPEGGRMLCCDVSEEWTAIAVEHWEAAGVADRIDLRIAPAIETLRALPADAQIDVAFIDADKGGYVDYYEEILTRLSPHGVMAVDNVLWSGQVLDADTTDDSTIALRAFNDHVAADERSVAVMLPIGDGVTLIRRREEAVH